jgi:hypothetical protein
VRNVPGFLSVAYSANGLKTNQEWNGAVSSRWLVKTTWRKLITESAALWNVIAYFPDGSYQNMRIPRMEISYCWNIPVIITEHWSFHIFRVMSEASSRYTGGRLLFFWRNCCNKFALLGTLGNGSMDQYR